MCSLSIVRFCYIIPGQYLVEILLPEMVLLVCHIRYKAHFKVNKEMRGLRQELSEMKHHCNIKTQSFAQSRTEDCWSYRCLWHFPLPLRLSKRGRSSSSSIMWSQRDCSVSIMKNIWIRILNTFDHLLLYIVNIIY